MKKTLSIIAASALAIGGLEAASDIVFDSFSTDTQITLSDGTFASTLEKGYVVSFWYSETGDDYQAIGISGFADLDYGDEYAGYIFYTSAPLLTTPQGETGYLSIRIFEIEDMKGSTSAEWQAYLDTMNATIGTSAGSVEIDALWTGAMLNSSEIGEWNASYVAGLGGSAGDPFYTWFEWGTNPPASLEQNIIPEPSTYAAALGAVVLAFAAYRRRK